jgi:hypothetical protein
MRKPENTNVEEIHTYLFGGQPHLLAESVRTWLDSSRRFAAFAADFRYKIRKKLRVTQDEETLYDLRLELETAYLLLQERALSLVYEPQPTRDVRGPDFAVTFTTSLTFMVEVTRLRAAPSPETSPTSQAELERLADAVCSKLGQFLPQRSNVLIVGVDALSLQQDDLRALMLRVQQRAERDDTTFWRRYGFRDRAEFFRCYQRLTEILIRRTHLRADEPAVVWVNPQAKDPLASKVRTALHRSQTLGK